MRKCHLIYPLLLILLAGISSCEKKEKGCTDPTASNFNIHADEDDGTCTYTNFLEGQFRFVGNKFGSGGSSAFEMVFVIEDLGDGNYKISQLDGCNDVRVRSQNNSLMLQSSDCGIGSWNFNAFGLNMSLSFSRFDGSTNFNYSGSVSKL